MRIEWQIKVEDPRFLELKIDGAVWKVVHRATYSRQLSPLKMCASLDDLKKAFSKLERKVAEQSALRLLAKRDYFIKELSKKLTEKGFSKEAAARAIEKCQKLGYLSDEKLTERTLVSLKRRGKGPRYIAQKLKERLGFLPPLPRDEEGEREAIAALLRKRFPNIRGEKEQGRAIRFLQARGFDLGQIFQVIKRLDN